MGVDELELFLLRPSAFDQFADHPQPIGTVRLGDLTSLLDGFVRMSPGQAEQAHQDPNARNAPGLKH